MCYTAKYIIEKALKRARHYGVKEDIIRYEEELRNFEDHEKASGFSHPEVIIYTNEAPYHPILSVWGLIPHWIKDENQAKTIWNKTLNARGESLFQKPSFRDAVRHHRCLIPIAGFYEYHHQGKSTIPYYIERRDQEPIMLAGLWSEWHSKEQNRTFNTCSIVTTKANPLMAKIHNNPKLSEARMPLILRDGAEDNWLRLQTEQQLKLFLEPYPQEELRAMPEKKNIQPRIPGL